MKPWRAAVANAAFKAMSDAGLDPFDEPVVVDVVFLMPRPKSVTRQWPSVAPDTDKLCRAIGDALSVDSPVLTDDSRIVKWGNPTKIYADIREPGVWVRIRVADDKDMEEAVSNVLITSEKDTQ